MHIQDVAKVSANTGEQATVDGPIYRTSPFPVSQNSEEIIPLASSRSNTSFMRLLVQYLCISAAFITFSPTSWCTIKPQRAKSDSEHVFPNLYEASITELQKGLKSGDFSSVDLVKAYFARIDEVNSKAPSLRAVIELNPSALAQAVELDAERNKCGPRSLLSVIAGKDPNDNYTLTQPDKIPDYTKALKNGLVGKRIGVPRNRFAGNASHLPDIEAAFEVALVTLKSLGATIVDPAPLPDADELLHSQNETVVLNIDIKEDLNAYFAGLKKNLSGVQTLADLIQYDIDHADLELPPGYEDQFQFLISEGTTGGIDAALKKYQLDALVSPVSPFEYAVAAAAIAGYPIITVPLGFFSDNVTIGHSYPQTLYPAPGVPFGLSFFGTAYSEFNVISIGYAFEQETQARLKRRAYHAAIPKTQLKDVVGV